MDRFMKKISKCLTRLSAIAIFTAMLEAAVAAQQPVPRPSPQRQPPTQSAPQAPAATAQPAPAAQSALDGAPQRTTATYEDWTLQCEIQAGTPPRKVCEMTQVTQLQGKNQPFSRAEVVRTTKDQPTRLVIQVPVNVSFAAYVRVQIGDADPALAVPFTRCLPSGCFADFDLKDDTLKKFRSAGSPGKLTFADSSGRDLSVPLSFNGFGQAYDALLKE
jgi:invasion protein IalB